MAEEKDVKVEFCLGKESQEASNYEEMLKHAGHKIQIVSFPRPPRPRQKAVCTFHAPNNADVLANQQRRQQLAEEAKAAAKAAKKKPRKKRLTSAEDRP